MTLGFALVALSGINPEKHNSKDCLKFLTVWMVKGPNKLQGECQLIAENSSSI